MNVNNYSETPGEAFDGALDYSTSEHRKLYERATRGLFTDDQLFDCTPDGLLYLLDKLKSRGEQYGWLYKSIGDNFDEQGILYVSTNPNDANADLLSLIADHGRIELDRIREQELMYRNNETRRCQDSVMLFNCLLNSLSKEGHQKVSVWKDEYYVNDRCSGPLLLKVILRESHIDTNATSTAIRDKLGALDLYMASVGHDITKFNAYVKSLVTQLRARGQTSTDLMNHLFKGYKACSDHQFVKYIENKEEKFEEGEDITPDQLMLYANNKFKIRKTRGAWNAPDASEEKILALQTELAAMKKKLKSTKNGQGGKKGEEKKGKEKKDDKKNNSKPKWMSEEPPSDEMNKPKTWKNLEWYWCCPKTGGKCEGIWRRHKPSECKGTAKRKNTESDNKSNGKKVRLQKAYEALMEYQSDEE